MKKILLIIVSFSFLLCACHKKTAKPAFVDEIKLYVDTKILKKNIKYPFEVNSKQNLLTDTAFNYVTGKKFMVAAFIPKGQKLKIVCTGANGSLGTGGNWIMENQGWTITKDNSSFTYEAKGNDKTVSVPFMSTTKTIFNFTIFENGSKSPTRVRSVSIQ
jgi:hypothetical protein